MVRFNLRQSRNPFPFTPLKKQASGSVVSHAGILIPDISRKKFNVKDFMRS
jgi:hypothetical protein